MNRYQFPRVAILIFPFASGALYNWSLKTATTISAVSSGTVVVGGRIPEQMKWPSEVAVKDIGVRLHYLRQIKPLLFSAIIWFYKAILAQVLLALEVYKLRHNIDAIYCLMGVYYQLPILVAHLLGKKVLSASMGVFSLKARISYGPFIALITSLLTRMNFALSAVVVVESLRLGEHPDLKMFAKKLQNGALYLQNPENFRSTTHVSERRNVVGFIGRMVKEKGILDFINAIPLFLENCPELEIIIVGTGILDETVEEALRNKIWSKQVSWIHWVEPNQVPSLLNRLKLLVVPSYDEGMPSLVLEAMGCETPVLASKVGAIPDLIREGQTGLVLENNEPITIAEGVVRAMKDANLDFITANARRLIEQEYTLEAAISRYEKILTRISTI